MDYELEGYRKLASAVARQVIYDYRSGLCSYHSAVLFFEHSPFMDLLDVDRNAILEELEHEEERKQSLGIHGE